jgi:phosphoribosylamine--glycine ligase
VTKVLIVGGGAREHALAWRAAQCAGVRQVLVAPGNAGTASEPGVSNVDVDAQDIGALLDLAMARRINLTIVGPEAPLVAGIVDAFEDAGLHCFGPSRAAAVIEGSKGFAKDFLARHRIPTADYARFTDPAEAAAYIRAQAAPLVVKADGLAAGKGVIIASSHREAESAARDMLEAGAFGAAGREVVIEEYLAGEEVSFIVMTDGEAVLPFASSQDHKRRDDGDGGPNTGGMGAYSPAPVVDAALHARIMTEIIQPTVRGMAAEGRRYRGFLYAGLIIRADGSPMVLEFNCRFGDPEAQPVLMRLRSDLVALCWAALDGTLGEKQAQWDPRVALAVVMAAGGYPGAYRKGDPIAGLARSEEPDLKVFHAGTIARDGRVLTAGGRVLSVCALGDSLAAARRRAYERVSAIAWSDAHYRRDIGARALAREASGRRP